MKIRFFSFIFIALVPFLSFSSLSAWQDCPCDDCCLNFDYSLELHGGYRWDRLNNVVGVVVPNNSKMTRDILKAKSLSIWEVGAQAEISTCSGWFLKGYYYHGWIVSGRFSNAGITGRQRGHTDDAQIGLGYLFPLNCCWSIAPIAGWSYDQQKTHLHDANPSQFQGLKYGSIWNGPWIGFEVNYQMNNCWAFEGGYEFHWPEWRGEWLLRHQVSTAFSDKRRVGSAFGHVVYINGRWNFADQWHASLELKYRYYSTRGIGNLDSVSNAPFTTTAGPVTVVNFVQRMRWHSYAISMNVGYDF